MSRSGGRFGARLLTLRRLACQLLTPAGWLRRKPDAPQRILVLHHLLLGDTLMLTPLLARIAARYPQAERFLACPAAFNLLYTNQPYGFQALPWNPRKPEGLQALFAAAPFDLVVIPAENRYSPLARALGARWVLGFAGDTPRWKNWLLDEARPFPEAPAAFGDFCADLIDGPAGHYKTSDWRMPAAAPFKAPAGSLSDLSDRNEPSEKTRPDSSVFEAHSGPMQRKDGRIWGVSPAGAVDQSQVRQAAHPYAVLHLGASTPLKYWPAERWMALADWLAAQGITPVWSAGAKETALVTAADPQARYTSYAGQLDLAQLAELFAQARLIVCPDTGVAHLARITGTPTVALFGPGSSLISGAGKFWADSPFTALSVDIACRNQTNTFRRHAEWIKRCSRSFGPGEGQCDKARCMLGIGLEAVQAACTNRLNQDAS